MIWVEIRYLQGFMEAQRASICLGAVAEHFAGAQAAGAKAEDFCVPAAWGQSCLHFFGAVLRMCRCDDPYCTCRWQYTPVVCNKVTTGITRYPSHAILKFLFRRFSSASCFRCLALSALYQAR